MNTETLPIMALSTLLTESLIELVIKPGLIGDTEVSPTDMARIAHMVALIINTILVMLVTGNFTIEGVAAGLAAGRASNYLHDVTTR